MKEGSVRPLPKTKNFIFQRFWQATSKEEFVIRMILK